MSNFPFNRMNLGFFFGWKNLGTPLIFEIRGHDVDVVLRDNEKMARLTFYRMSEDCNEGDCDPTPYENQTLKLSKFFSDW